MVRLLAPLVLFFLVSSCAHKSRSDQNSLRAYFEQNDFETAERFLEKSSLKEKDNRLLYLMDKAILAFYQKRFAQAARIFNQANELVDRLYTKSIRKMLASSIVNDNLKTFYGSLFERSMLYYFQALSFYQLNQQGFKQVLKLVDGKRTWIKIKLSKDQKRQYLNRVRSTLVAWDSFFKDIQRSDGAKTFLKDDFFAKMFAANLHLQLNTKRDSEIALQLYKDALKSFDLYAPTMKSFNPDYRSYNRELRAYFDKNKSTKKPIASKKNAELKKTRRFLLAKILDITKAIRPKKFRKALKRYKLKGYEFKKHNVTLHIESQIINPTKGKDYSFNLRSAIDKIDNPKSRALIDGIGVPILTMFAAGPLGLGYVSRHGNTTVYSRHRAGEEMVKEVGIEFELPYAEANTDKPLEKIIVKQGDKVIERVGLTAMISLSDIAFINAQERIENSFKSRGARVGIKYALALAAAYGTYQRLQKSNQLFAKPAALAQFLVSQKAIKASEKADVRHWTTLPNFILTAELSLKPGRYQLFGKRGNKEVLLREIDVKGEKRELFSHRVF